jgi:D-serine deaminase-like pyridoxal phosphate-dependent protein
MASLHDLPTPALLLDVDRLEANLRWMADRAANLGVSLRPHIKTHKCVEIAERQRDVGATGITVSTLYEARVFADHGFDDITWAFPVILSRIPDVVELAGRVRLQVTADSREAVDALGRTGEPLNVVLKVDCGYHRAGVDPEGDEVLALAGAVADSASLQLAGILSHSGHAYGVDSAEGAAAVAEEERSVMVRCAERLRGEGIDIPTVSVGSTPAMRAVADLSGVTEARPGNYALFDYTQVTLGSCTAAECAATVLSSVVSSQPGAEHCIVDAGALVLSKDPGPGPPHHPTMGEVYREYDAGELDPDTRLSGMSQEHGRLNRRLPVGTLLRILPNHSCLTVAEFEECYAVRGAEVVDRWKIWSGRD